MLKLGRAPNAAAGSVGWELAARATVAIWLARMTHSNRCTDIDFLLEHIVGERIAMGPIVSTSVLCAQILGNP
jgi:hypothetical protein